MKALILTEGGEGNGLGHIGRCGSFYQGLKERKWRVHFVIYGDRLAERFIEAKGFEAQVRPGTERGKLFHGYDLVLIDSYNMPLTFYKKISAVNRLLISLDDYKRLPYPSGIVINGGILAQQLRYPKNGKLVYLLGTDYQFLPKEYWDLTRFPEQNRWIKRILMTFGGRDLYNLSERAIETLLAVENDWLDRIDVAGANDSNKAFTVLKQGIKVTYHPQMVNLKPLVQKADLAVAAGGQTLYEFACFGLPTIAICLADNQLMNLKGWETRGFLRFAGWYDEPGLFESIRRRYQELLSRKKRADMAKAGRAMMKANTVRNMVRMVEERFKNAEN